MAGIVVGMESAIALIKALSIKTQEYCSRRWGRIIFCLLSGLIIVLVVGLRNTSIGSDTSVYVAGFEHIKTVNWDSIFSTHYVNFETGFIIFNKIISMISNSVHVYCIACATLSILPFAYWIYKKSKYPLLSFVIFIGIPSFIWVFSGARQLVAVGICVFATIAAQNKKLIWFIIFVLIATTFHYTAFIYLIVYPTYWYRVRSRGITFTLLGVCFLARVPLFHILKLVLKKEEYVVEGTNAYMMFFVLVCLYIFCVVLSKKREEHNGLLNILLLACLTQMFGSVNELASRMAFYFIPVLVILIPCVLYDYKPIISRYVFYFGVLAVFGSYAVYSIGGAAMLSNVGGYFFWTY